MPYVTIAMLEGRTVEQKRDLVKAVTEAIVQSIKAKPESVHVIVQELPGTNFAREGVLLADRK